LASAIAYGNHPEANIVVGSDVQPYSGQGGTDSIIELLTNSKERTIAGASEHTWFKMRSIIQFTASSVIQLTAVSY
jgi:hypothetical protein